jgi:hypothetical protein
VSRSASLDQRKGGEDLETCREEDSHEDEKNVTAADHDCVMCEFMRWVV